MNKFDLTPPPVSNISLLTFSTWLVLGGWLIFTGLELIFNTSNGDNSFTSYLLGAVRLLIGTHVVISARTLARLVSEPHNLLLRVLTFIILIAVVGLPFFVFISQTLLILFKENQPNELYQENAIRLLAIAICYLLATIFAGWRLKK